MRFELVDRLGRQHATTAPAMNKIATGVEAKDFIDINAPVAENLKGIARAKKKTISEITVVVLDRPRNEQLLSDIRSAGATVKLISDGDVAASIEAALPEKEVDMLMGIGGTPEAVLSAAAIHCIGGNIQCVAWPRDWSERDSALAKGDSCPLLVYPDSREGNQCAN